MNTDHMTPEELTVVVDRAVTVEAGEELEVRR